MNTAVSPRDLIAKVIAEADRHLSSVEHYEQQADAVLAVVRPEIDILLSRVEEQREINAGWVAYGQRAKRQRRKHAEDMAAAIGYDFSKERWLPIEAMIPLAAERFNAIRLEREIVSGLLRGMARRTTELRRKYRSLSRSYVRLGSERDEKQFEIERLRRWIDRFRERAAERQTAVERVLTEKDNQRWQLAKAISAATDLPWDELIVETRRVTEEWLARGTEIKRLRLLLARQDGNPNPWFTPAEFPIEQHEHADRESVDLATLTGAAEFDRMFPPACGQVHDGVECPKPRVPETNGCWAHYGPEAADERTVRTEHVPGTPPSAVVAQAPERVRARAARRARHVDEVPQALGRSGWRDV